MAPHCCGNTEGIIFVLSEPICVKWLHIRLRLESLDDTDFSNYNGAYTSWGKISFGTFVDQCVVLLTYKYQ